MYVFPDVSRGRRLTWELRADKGVVRAEWVLHWPSSICWGLSPFSSNMSFLCPMISPILSPPRLQWPCYLQKDAPP